MRQLGSARPALALALLLPMLQMAACAGPGYYAQAVSGHLGLMRARQEIAEILATGDADPELARKLELAGQLREFAPVRLDLPDTGSFTHFVRTGRDAVTWNVVATPELSLEPRRWCFLVAGCVPYRGYFQHTAARTFANRLAADGLDVAVSPAVAYSTLGWFDDPLLDTMLRHSDEGLAALMFHELAHQKLYLRGDTAFNESYASFVEEIGVTLWLQSSSREDRLKEWRAQRQAAGQFDNLLLQARSSLAGLYAGHSSDDQKRRGKTDIFDRLETEYRNLVDDQWQGRDFFGNWFGNGINNARLALFASYRGGVCAFSALYHDSGRDMARFHQQAAEWAGAAPEARRDWLQQPCPAVASPVDL
jgi:predicted aminopeptidase